MASELEFHNAENYSILSENEKSMMIKIDFRSLNQTVDIWAYNREIKPEIVEKLFENIQDKSNNIVWTLTAIKERKSSHLFLIDGQHRYEAIKNIMQDDIDFKEERFVFIQVYLIDNIDTDNEYIIDLFIKINNHTPLNIPDFPSDKNIKLIKKIIEDKILKNGISIDEKRLTAHQPRIHKKTLHTKLNEYNDYNKDLTDETIIQNLKIINNYIGLKSYEEIFKNEKEAEKDKNKNAWEKAKELKFYIGFRNCNEKYVIDNIIKNICNPEIFI
jgi:hypothetical protein